MSRPGTPGRTLSMTNASSSTLRTSTPTAGRARGRLHRAVDDPLSRRRLRADPADGGHRGAAVPRVRGDLVGGDHDLAGRLTDHDADDVRLFAGSAARR